MVLRLAKAGQNRPGHPPLAVILNLRVQLWKLPDISHLRVRGQGMAQPVFLVPDRDDYGSRTVPRLLLV